MQKAKGGKIRSYAVLRVLLTILVVISHCAYYSIKTKYGGIGWSGAIKAAGITDTFSHDITSTIVSILYYFHVQLFFALSGALFEYGNKKTFLVTLKGKAKRLLIPFLVATTFVSVPLKFFAGYWSNSASVFKDIFVGQYLIQGNTHLWFLPVLFLIFLFFSLIYRFEKKSLLFRCVLFAAALGCTFVYAKIPIKLFSCFFRYVLWFYVGMLFERKREKWDRFFNFKTMFLFLAFWVGIYFSHFYLKGTSLFMRLGRESMLTAITFLAMMFCYALCNGLSKTKFADLKPIRITEKYSLGIYLYSDPWNYVILSAFVGMFSINAFGSELAATLLFFARLIISFSAALLISVILRKLKIKYIS